MANANDLQSKIENRKSKIEEPWTVGRLLSWTEQYFAAQRVEFPRLDAQVLLAHTLGCKRIDLYGLRFEEVATEEVRRSFRELIRKRVEGCPVAYLVGRKEFYNLEFEVNPSVLIPRPDTECVVGECLRLARELDKPQVVDLGTGSGAIAVAVAQKHKRAQVTAVDLSAEALAVAARNAARHGVADRVRFLQGDLFGPIAAGECFDFVLSNPPYIPHEEMNRLPPGVRDYEPHLALDGGPGGYVLFDRLLDQARARLKPGGYLLVEISSLQEGPARQRVMAHAGYELGKTILDGSGHPRVLRVRWRPEGSR
jgi:release factor glutamine methyltransferase